MHVLGVGFQYWWWGKEGSFSASMYDKKNFFIKMETQKLGSEWQLTQERAICVLNKNLHLIMKQNFNLSFCNDTQISHNIKNTDS